MYGVKAILLSQLIQVATEIFNLRYQSASVMFLDGSIVRGESTPYSDLDLVVVFDKLPNAYRESFYSHGYPVEAFIHDPETLNYFITESELAAGVCVMAQMVAEGIEIPASSALSQWLKQLAASVIGSRPPRLSEEDLRRMRYNITNLVDDIRHPRSKEELTAVGTLLYEALANCYFRTNDLWTAKGKSIPRKLKTANPALWRRFSDGFEELFAAGRTELAVALAEEILASVGGFLFDGHKLEAPAANRKPLERGRD